MAGRTDPHPTFRFAVQVDQFEMAIFDECSLPSLEVDVLEQQEGGFNSGVHLLPGRVKAGRLTLKRGVFKSSEMLKWYQAVLDKSKRAEAVKRTVTVKMLDIEGQPVMTLNFERTFPVKWTGPTFKADDNTIAVESLELAFGEVKVG